LSEFLIFQEKILNAKDLQRFSPHQLLCIDGDRLQVFMFQPILDTYAWPVADPVGVAPRWIVPLWYRCALFWFL